jgi:parallel beta-helix repeat protein
VSWPTGVVLRTCSLGPDFGIVSGEDYGCDIVVSVSRPTMTWGATGSGGIGDTETLSFDPGQEVTFQLPVTDQEGWYIGGLPVDVSDGRQSHVYTLTIKPWIYGSLGRKTYSNATPTLSNLAVPTGDGVLDLDLSVATSGAQGGTVTIPSLVADLQGAVESYADAAAASATAAESAAQQAHDISNIDTTDDAVSVLVGDPSAGPKTSAALNAAFAAQPGDGSVFLAPRTGDDANDGRTWGKAKATLSAAIAALAPTGGTIFAAGGAIAEHDVVIDRDNVEIVGYGYDSKIDATGTDKANAIIAIGRNNVHVRGFRISGSGKGNQPANAGTAPTVADLANSGCGVIFAGCSNSTVTDCVFDGHGGTTGVGDFNGVAAVWLTNGCTDCRVEGNTITNSRNGINEDNYFGANPHGNKILNNIIDGCRFGIACDSESASTGSLVAFSTAYPVAYNTLIQGNTIRNCLQSGIDLNKARRVRAAFNYVESCGTETGNSGIAIYGTASNYAIDCLVEGNSVFKCGQAGVGGHGIKLADFAYNVKVIGNTLAGNQGDGVHAQGAIRHCTISLNDVAENVASGVTFNGNVTNGNVGTNTISGNKVQANGQHGISVQGLVGGIITGNTIRNNGTATANTYDGLRLDVGSTRNVITGNYSQGASQRFNVSFIDANSINNTVEGNDFGEAFATSGAVGVEYGTARCGMAAGAETQQWGVNYDRLKTTAGAPSGGGWANGAMVINTGDSKLYTRIASGSWKSVAVA